MFKKNAWIAGLIAALAIMFVGCLPQPEVEDTSGFDEVVIVDLKRAIAGKSGPVNAESGATGFGQISGDKADYFNPAGGIPSQVTFNIVSGQGLEVFPVATWGAGLDLTHSKIDFRAGDKVYIKGKAIQAGQFLLNLNHSGWTALGSWDPTFAAGEEFEKEFILTEADIGQIKGTSPQAIRIRRGTAAATASFLISELTVSGLRPKSFEVGPGGYKGASFISYCSDPNCPTKSRVLTADAGVELWGSGIFECPECRPANATGFTSAAPATYNKPADTDDYFYLDLSDLNAGSGGKIINIDQVYEKTADGNVKVEANKVTYYFEANTQPLAINLSTAQRDKVIEALRAGLWVDVEITAKGSPRMGMRFGFGDPTTGDSWNGSEFGTGFPVLINSGKLEKRVVPHSNIGTSGATKRADTFIIQLREARKSALEIESIKVVMPGNQNVTISELPLNVPVTGAIIPKTIETSQYIVNIEWEEGGSPISPTLTRFESNTQYTANIVLVPKTYFSFTNGPYEFTIGNIIAQVSGYNSTLDLSKQEPKLKFVFPSTVIAGNFAGTIKAQSGSPLTDISAPIKLGTVVTATYAPGAGDPAVSAVTYTWQREGAGSVFTDVGTGATFTPGKLGTYRVVLKANNYVDKESDTFAATLSDIMTGSKDTELNATYTKTDGATTYWSFATWIATQGTSFTGASPFAKSGTNMVVDKVANGWNITNRSADGDCPILITDTALYGHDGLTNPAFNDNTPMNVVDRKYKIVVYGYVIGSPGTTPARMVLQKNSDGWTYLPENPAVNVTEFDGSFRLSYELPADFNMSANIRITCATAAVDYRITLIEIEDLGARE